MKTVTSQEVSQRPSVILDRVPSEPVMITRDNGEPHLLVISASQYDDALLTSDGKQQAYVEYLNAGVRAAIANGGRLPGFEDSAKRKAAGEALIALAKRTSEEAERNGLTPEIMQSIIDDE